MAKWSNVKNLPFIKGIHKMLHDAHKLFNVAKNAATGKPADIINENSCRRKFKLRKFNGWRKLKEMMKTEANSLVRSLKLMVNDLKNLGWTTGTRKIQNEKGIIYDVPMEDLPFQIRENE